MRSITCRPWAPACSYTTDIVEFCSTEHTPRNLLIRAVKGADRAGSSGARSSGSGSAKARGKAAAGHANEAAAALEYKALAHGFGVVPYLQTLLQDELAPLLGAAGQQGNEGLGE